MELADDASVSALVRARPEQATASQAANPDHVLTNAATYVPRTLQSDLKSRGKLPLDECAKIGLSLATAVQHLHEHGLIHRDIKLSNVIFVHGVPKLADIGLVAQKDSTMSFVGTRGYFPPEGPGTAQADIYSLGKVLYEISTGKDRNEFPDLPSNLEDLTEESRLLEFNEILLKACHGDPRQRYSSVRELFDDLSLLQEGKSVKQKRGRERLAANARKVLVGLALVLAVGTGGYPWPTSPHASEVRRPASSVLTSPSSGNLFPLAKIRPFSGWRSDRECGCRGETNSLFIWDEKTSINRPLTLRGIEGW
jgi:serine/threonine protein kinase